MEDYLPVKAEIDLGAVAHNIRELRRITSPAARVMAVVKANGYGHGAVNVGRIALENGAERLGVARLEEALALRQAGIRAPVLVFGAISPQSSAEYARHQITATVTGLESAKAVSRQAEKGGFHVTVHIKVDTGVGRLGIVAGNPAPDQKEVFDQRTLVEEIRAIRNLPGLNCEGIYTHLADADGVETAHCTGQMNCFTDLLSALEKAGIRPPIAHGANSAATLRYPDFHLDMVRPGISTYGLPVLPPGMDSPVVLKPAMTLTTRVVQVKRVPAGFGVSYNVTWKSGRPSVLATVSIGYADGLPRILSNKGHMMVHGIKVPVAGRICMDMCILDVTQAPDTRVGDEVLIFGENNGHTLPAKDLADAAGTIHYELVAALTARVPRIYKG